MPLRNTGLNSDFRFLILIQKRIDPMGMIRFWNKLEESSGDMPRAAEYFSTHPLTSDRIEQLSRLAAQADYTPVPLLPGYEWAQMGTLCKEQP